MCSVSNSICHLHSHSISVLCCWCKKRGCNLPMLRLLEAEWKKCPTHICITKYPKCNRQFMKQNFFALLDQSKVYHQLHLHFDIWKCTAFITSWSFYQLVNLPYGLINVPTCFQRFMEQCLSDYPEWLPFFYNTSKTCWYSPLFG